jgi:hypothetical protein
LFLVLVLRVSCDLVSIFRYFGDSGLGLATNNSMRPEVRQVGGRKKKTVNFESHRFVCAAPWGSVSDCSCVFGKGG